MSSVPEIGKNKDTPLFNLSYERWLELKKYRKSSLVRMRIIQAHLLRYLKKEELSLSKSSLLSYAYWVLDQGYSEGYVSKLYSNIRQYYKYLKQIHNWSGYLELPKIQCELVRRVALSIEEKEEVVNWLSSNETPLRSLLWSLFYGCGLRKGELLNLSISDVYYRSKYLKVKSLKNGKVRHIPLSSRQLNALLSYLEVRPNAAKGYGNYLVLGPRGKTALGLLGRELAKWQVGTGLGSRLCWHVLRHTIATDLVNAGIEIRLVSRFLGHSSIQSTHHYLHYLKTK